METVKELTNRYETLSDKEKSDLDIRAESEAKNRFLSLSEEAKKEYIAEIKHLIAYIENNGG